MDRFIVTTRDGGGWGSGARIVDQANDDELASAVLSDFREAELAEFAAFLNRRCPLERDAHAYLAEILGPPPHRHEWRRYQEHPYPRSRCTECGEETLG